LPTVHDVYPACQCLIAALEFDAIRIDRLFSSPATSDEAVASLKETVLTTGAVPADTDPRDAACCLLDILYMLPDPPLRSSCHERLLAAAYLPEHAFQIEAIRAVLQGLPFNELRLLKFVLYLLHKTIKAQYLLRNQVALNELVAIFQSALMRNENDGAAAHASFKLIVLNFAELFLDTTNPLPLLIAPQVGGWSKGTLPPPPRQRRVLPRAFIPPTPIAETIRAEMSASGKAIEGSKSLPDTSIKVIRTWLGETTGDRNSINTAQQSIDDIITMMDNAPFQ